MATGGMLETGMTMGHVLGGRVHHCWRLVALGA